LRRRVRSKEIGGRRKAVAVCRFAVSHIAKEETMKWSSMRWQDWACIALGAWLLASPWVLGFSAIGAAAWNAAIFGLAIIVLTVADVAVPDPWPERVSLPVSLWIAISPLMLGFAAHGPAAVSTALSGALIALLTAWTVWSEQSGREAPSH
jgi:hypothetical protein